MELKLVIKQINNKGGSAFLVGGSVIDKLRGNNPKDIDIEVFGISYDTLIECLSGFGNPKAVGKEFGIVTTFHKGMSYDFSLPRTENRIGVKHTDFKIVTDPNMTIEEAARRRDLTINSMSWDLQKDELVDPFDGAIDLINSRLKATDPNTFVEDPLRVLRIMQFLAREKGTFVDPSTMTLCQNMIHEFDYLTHDRVFREFNKMLLQGTDIPLGLKFLDDCGWLVHFPILQNMQGVKQDPAWHPEGDVWVHTMEVVQNATILREHIPDDWKLPYMYSALLHDIGKPEMSRIKDGRIISHGHENYGETLAKVFMKSLTDDKALIKKVVSLVGNHMQPRALLRGKAGSAAWRRLFNKTNLEILGWLSKADRAGRSNVVHLSADDPAQLRCSSEFIKLSKESENGKIKPILRGRDLINKGRKPGPIFSAILEKAYRIQINYGIKWKWLLHYLATRGLS